MSKPSSKKTPTSTDNDTSSTDKETPGRPAVEGPTLRTDPEGWRKAMEKLPQREPQWRQSFTPADLERTIAILKATEEKYGEDIWERDWDELDDEDA